MRLPRLSYLLLWLVSLLTAGSIGYVAGTSHSGQTAVATVNGEALTEKEFESALKHLNGSEVLRRLTEQKLVLQEARRLGLQVDRARLDQSQYPDKKRERVLAKLADEEVKARLLLRDLIVREISKEEKLETYRLFKDELTQYELFGVQLADPSEAEDFRRRFNEGETYEHLVQQYSVNPANKEQQGRIGFVTLPAIRNTFGPAVAVTVRDSQAGALSSPLQTPFGTMLVKVGHTRSTYEELQESVEDMIAESRRLAFLHNLVSAAEIRAGGYAVKMIQDEGAGPTQ